MSAPQNPDIHQVAPARMEGKAQLRIWQAGTLNYTTGGLAILFFWLLWGDVAWSLKERSILPMGQLVLKQLHASDFINGLLMGALPSLIAMLIQPVVSFASDRHRGKMGRRIPYLLFTIPVAVAGIIGLGFSVRIASVAHVMLGEMSPGATSLSLLVFGLFWILFECGSLAANVVFLGLINDVVPQYWLGRFFGLFRLLGLIAGVFFNYCLLGLVEEHYLVIFIAIAGVYGIGFLLMCFKVREGDYPPPPNPSGSARPGFLTLAGTYFRECFGKPYYILVFIAYNLCFAAFVPVNLFGLFYAKSLNMEIDAYGKLIALTYIISICASYPLGVLADKFHPLRVGILSSLIYALWMIYAGLTVHTIPAFSIALVAHTVLSGVFFTTTASLGQRLFPKDRFGQFYSALMIVQSLGVIAVPLFVGSILDWTHHDYRNTFLIGGVLSAFGTGVSMVVYRKFLRLGGHQNYQAP